MQITLDEQRIYPVRIARETDAAVLRGLLNESYRELAERGLNYTATFQNEQDTLEQIRDRRVFVVHDGAKLIGTISMHDENRFTGKRSSYIGKFGIHPSSKSIGLGTRLIALVESIARGEGYAALQLDTAKDAMHLVDWYQRLGFRIIGEDRFAGKTYESWIFEKVLD